MQTCLTAAICGPSSAKLIWRDGDRKFYDFCDYDESPVESIDPDYDAEKALANAGITQKSLGAAELARDKRRNGKAMQSETGSDSRYDPAKMSEEQISALLSLDCDTQEIHDEFRRFSLAVFAIRPVVTGALEGCDKAIKHSRIDAERPYFAEHLADSALPVSGESSGYSMPSPILHFGALSAFVRQLECAIHSESLEFRPIPVWRGNTLLRLDV